MDKDTVVAKLAGVEMVKPVTLLAYLVKSCTKPVNQICEEIGMSPTTIYKNIAFEGDTNQIKNIAIAIGYTGPIELLGLPAHRAYKILWKLHEQKKEDATADTTTKPEIY